MEAGTHNFHMNLRTWEQALHSTVEESGTPEGLSRAEESEAHLAGQLALTLHHTLTSPMSPEAKT